jgi:hypothetical protein
MALRRLHNGRMRPAIRVLAIGASGSTSSRMLAPHGRMTASLTHAWNRTNGDLALAAWYRDVGSRMAFDVAHFIEWALLLLTRFDRLYASVPEGAVGLTALTPTSLIQDDSAWLQRPRATRSRRLR